MKNDTRKSENVTNASPNKGLTIEDSNIDENIYESVSSTHGTLGFAIKLDDGAESVNS